MSLPATKGCPRHCAPLPHPSERSAAQRHTCPSRARHGSKHKTRTKTMNITQCPECGAFSTASFDEDWLQCLHCSRISYDPYPKDPFPQKVWQPPADCEADPATAFCSGSITEHAQENSTYN
jgi:hypothetical protein